LKRIEVWIDCQEGQEEEARQKVKSALDSLHFKYTILTSSSQLGKTEESQK
jgi:hypothetical protein